MEPLPERLPFYSGTTSPLLNQGKGPLVEASAWLIFLSAIFATYIWRFAAVMISHRIEPNHPIFEWFTCLAYGIIAALVARTLVFPMGILQEIPLWQRLLSMVFAFLGFYLLGKRLWVGILFGEFAFLLLIWFHGFFWEG